MSRTRAISATFVVTVGVISSQAGDPPVDLLSSEPVMLEETTAEGGWGAELRLTLWTVNMNGLVGADGLAAPVDLSFGDILDNLDFAIMGTADIRRRDSRIGFLLEGSYIKLSPSVDDVPLPFFSIDGIKVEQVLASAAVYYRLAEWQRGYFDIYAGARYMSVSTGLELTPNSPGITSVSQAISAEVASEVSRRAAEAVAKAKPIIISELQQVARAAIISGIIDGTIDPEKINPGTIALVKAIAAQQAAAIGSAARDKASAAVARLEKKLAHEIERKITDAVPDSVSGSADWVDPLVGMRARHFVTDRIYLAALADIGGFGAGSNLAWNAGGGVGGAGAGQPQHGVLLPLHVGRLR